MCVCECAGQIRLFKTVVIIDDGYSGCKYECGKKRKERWWLFCRCLQEFLWSWFELQFNVEWQRAHEIMCCCTWLPFYVIVQRKVTVLNEGCSCIPPV